MGPQLQSAISWLWILVGLARKSPAERERGHSEGIKGLERRINISAKDWHALKHGIFFEWPSNAVKKVQQGYKRPDFSCYPVLWELILKKLNKLSTRQDNNITNFTLYTVCFPFNNEEAEKILCSNHEAGSGVIAADFLKDLGAFFISRQNIFPLNNISGR